MHCTRPPSTRPRQQVGPAGPPGRQLLGATIRLARASGSGSRSNGSSTSGGSSRERWALPRRALQPTWRPPCLPSCTCRRAAAGPVAGAVRGPRPGAGGSHVSSGHWGVCPAPCPPRPSAPLSSSGGAAWRCQMPPPPPPASAHLARPLPPAGRPPAGLLRLPPAPPRPPSHPQTHTRPHPTPPHHTPIPRPPSPHPNSHPRAGAAPARC
jgi:hypothetical protein